MATCTSWSSWAADTTAVMASAAASEVRLTTWAGRAETWLASLQLSTKAAIVGILLWWDTRALLASMRAQEACRA